MAVINQFNGLTMSEAVNPNTGRSDADVYNQAEAVKKMVNDSRKGVVSSDSVLSQRNQEDAMNQAAGALVTSPGDQFRLSPMQQQYSNMMFAQQDENLGMFEDMRRGVDLMYDAQLARTNQQYGNLMQDLTQDFQKQSAIAEQQAAALNPYSEAQGAMTSRNFQSAIRSEYQSQAARLQEAASIAQNELAAGNAQAYIEITNAMKQSNQLFQKGMMQFMMDAQSSWQQGKQWEAEFGLDQARFGMDQQKFGESRFMDYINTFGADPGFKAALDHFDSTGEITANLQPVIQRGMAIGLTPEQAIATAGQETLAQAQMRMSDEQFREKMSLEWAKFNQSQIDRAAKLSDESVAEEDKRKAAVDQSVDLYSKLRELKTDPKLGNAVGNWFSRIGGGGWIPGTDQSDARVELLANQVAGLLTTDFLEAMEGTLTPVSDSDMRLLKGAAGGERLLRVDQNLEDYTDYVDELMGAIERTLQASGLDTDTMLRAGFITPEEAGVLNQSLTGVQSSSPAYWYGQ